MARSSAHASTTPWLWALLGVLTAVVAAIVVLSLGQRPAPGSTIPLDPTPPAIAAPAAPGAG